MKENLRKGNRGITLIALVITIIILLILAAVTIGALSGDNGILKNAADAKQETEKAQIIEQAKIDILGKQADNTSAELEKNEIKEVLDIYFKEVPEDFTSDTVLTTKEEYGNYEITVSEIYGGKIEEAGLTVGDMTEEQKKELIGKYVTNYEPASNNAIVTEEGIPGKWMIFNIDDENIYLIASDYITEVPAGKSGTNKPSIGLGSYPRGVSFSNILNDYAGGSADVTEIGKELNYDYFLNPEKAYTSTNDNMKAVAYMLDTNAWSSFRKEGVAEYAIGGPTIELLFEAYNKAHPDTNYTNGKYQARAKSATGYEISADGGEEGGNTWINSTTNNGANYLNNDDPTFVIDSRDNALGMWIASPSASYARHVMQVAYTGNVSYTSYDSYGSNGGFRPLVCLESRIELKKTGENIYEIIK